MRANRQAGVAIITALLLTTLAITIVGSLFWQQQVQVRSIENQRLQLQKQWIMRGALDWARLILREDARLTSGLDHLGEPWAVPLAETRLDQYVENQRSDADVPDAVLSGGIVDAQSRFNLKNLAAAGAINQEQVGVFARLLTNVQEKPELARATAEMMATAQASSRPPAAGAPPRDASAAQPLDILHVDDLLAVPGFTPETLAKLRNFVTVLPDPTPVNINTAPAEVLAARIDTLSLSEATALIAGRERRPFTSLSDERLQGKKLPSGPNSLALGTRYFLVNGDVRLNRAGLSMQALVSRGPGLKTEVVWIRES